MSTLGRVKITARVNVYGDCGETLAASAYAQAVELAGENGHVVSVTLDDAGRPAETWAATATLVVQVPTPSGMPDDSLDDEGAIPS